MHGFRGCILSAGPNWVTVYIAIHAKELWSKTLKDKIEKINDSQTKTSQESKKAAGKNVKYDLRKFCPGRKTEKG